MFSQSFFATALLLVAGLTSQVNAHSALAPALGVSGTPVRSDVQRPSTAKPCGTINIASTLDSSTAVTAAADGTFTVTATNFNAGTDGSTFYTAEVDPTAKGTAFVAATVTKNGVKSPTTVGSVPITVQLPAGTTCTGGAAGDLCLASFTSAGGFGNCVVVKQAGAGTAAAAAAVASTTAAAAASTTAAAGAAASTTAAAAATTAATGATGTAATGKHHHHQKAAAQNKRMVRVRRSHI